LTPTVTPTRKALANLQRLMRRPPLFAAGVVSRRVVPDALADDTELGLSREEIDAIRHTEETLLADASFEHLGKRAGSRVWYFACQCALDRKAEFVDQFMAEHAKELESRWCYVAVDYLKVASPCESVGVKFLPVDSSEIPRHERLPGLLSDPPVGSVAVVEVTGTDRERMAERALARVGHALRVLRIALREHRSIADQQLRFRLGRSYTFGPELTGWHLPDEAAVELELRQEFLDLAADVEVVNLPALPVTGIEKQADIAIRWMERAWFTGEPIVALLFMFFALEALLGDKSEGQKAHLLAFRQAMLSHAVTGRFPDPDRTFLLYDQVRSSAVHGEDAPVVERDLVHRFARSVRQTLSQYLRYARERGLQRRGPLLRVLDAHPDRAQLVDMLRLHGGPWWVEYFDSEEARAAKRRGEEPSKTE
jgi:hypothetical protein